MKTYLEAGNGYLQRITRVPEFAWGVTYGVPLDVMEEINSGFLDEDLALLLDGERFLPE